MLRDQLLDIIGYGIEALFETDRGAERCVARAEDEPLRKHLGANAHVHVPLVKPRRLQCATRDVRHLQVQGEVRGGVRRVGRGAGAEARGAAGPARRTAASTSGPPPSVHAVIFGSVSPAAVSRPTGVTPQPNEIRAAL